LGIKKEQIVLDVKRQKGYLTTGAAGRGKIRAGGRQAHGITRKYANEDGQAVSVRWRELDRGDREAAAARQVV